MVICSIFQNEYLNESGRPGQELGGTAAATWRDAAAVPVTLGGELVAQAAQLILRDKSGKL
ncbi:MAG: hypothetical protein ACAH10_13830 [Methylophilaceae bacterium]